MRTIGLVAAALLLQIGTANAAVQIKLPGCDAINTWSARVVATDTFTVAPKLALPKAFQDSDLVPVFGVAITAWSPEDVQAGSAALVKCYQEAGARRDTAAAAALTNANRALLGLVPATNAALKKAKIDADTAKAQVNAFPDSAELASAIEILVHANPAAPDPNAYRAIPRPVTDPIWRLATAALYLADTERAPLYQALADRAGKIASGMSDDATQAITAATPDAAGLIAVMQARKKAAAIGVADVRTTIAKSADDKAQQIRDSLRGAQPAVFVPPSCLELYRWSSAPNAGVPVNLAGHAVQMGFLDERVVPVFGLSVADWSDDDLARFKTLRGLCQSASQPAPAGVVAAPDVVELIQTATRGRWIEGADQPIAGARTTMAAYHKAQQDVTADLAKIAALPDIAASLLPLAQLAADPAQNLVSQDDHAKYVAAINAKRAAIGTQATAAAIKGLDDVKIASLADLPKLFTYVGQTGPTLPDQQGQQAFATAAARDLGDTTARLMPEFQSKLAALPDNLDGAAQANAAITKLTGIPDATASRLVALKPYYDAEHARAEAITKSVHDQACNDLLSSVGASGDGKQDLWDGHDGTTLGDFLCGIATRGATVNSYSGTGMLSSTATLKVTPLYQPILTVSLHKAEIKAGKSMFVGFKIVDADGKPGSQFGSSAKEDGTINVEQWEAFTFMTMGITGREDEACRKLNTGAADKLGPGDRLFLLYCVTLPSMQAGQK